ncbi:MAG TPA: preprotein translocase subunit SecY [Candidatus Azoamicus sp. MARI]
MNDLKNRIFFVIIILIAYRIGAHVPIPLLDTKQIMSAFSEEKSGILSLFNLFSGGALLKVTIFSLGIMPYISSSIIIQMLAFIWEPLKKLRKEGTHGKKKISAYTRYLTVVLSAFQAIAMSKFIIKLSIIENINILHYSTIVLTLVAGTIILMWLGEKINEKGIGNGISLIIFTSIVSNIPKTVATTLEKLRQDEINIIYTCLFTLVLLIIILLIIYVEKSQRKIEINYPKRQQGRKIYSAQSTYLPFKINMAGVIPPIFASSIILFPITIIQWLDSSLNNSILYKLKMLIMPGSILYLFIFGFFIIFFCFFYNNLIFNSDETAENLKKGGGFIQGIRPGEHTSNHIKKTVTKLTIIGSIYLTLVSLLPEILVSFTNIPFYFGGTSLLIVVVVIIDFISQIQARMISYKYDNLIKKYKK